MSLMDLRDFDYDLPAECIAQRPVPQRDKARLMVVGGGGGEGTEDPRRDARCENRLVSDLPDILRPGDLLVLNDTRVFPARLVGRKDTGGRVEALLLAPLSSRDARRQSWRAMLGASRMPRPGARLTFGNGLAAEVLEPPLDGEAVLALQAEEGVMQAIERIGQVPLPPYIERPDGPEPEDRERYQTVFACETGSSAAPTAGLHFTPALLARLDAAGIRCTSLTLHVGLGTFQPLRDGPLPDRLHAERYRLSQETADAVLRTRREGGRVIAVGTTVVRTLEHASPSGELQPGEGWCDLFIRPGFAFCQTNLLLTNFHLPRSSLLMLVAAFAGRERILACYREAVSRGYRFYSFGDAMLVAPRQDAVESQ